MAAQHVLSHPLQYFSTFLDNLTFGSFMFVYEGESSEFLDSVDVSNEGGLS